MGLPDSSPAAEPSDAPDEPRTPPKPGPKNTPTQRLNRRTYVEKLMVDGRRRAWIMVHVAKRFGISERMVKTDMRIVRARWAGEDSDYLDELRKRQLKALERIALRAEKTGDLAQARLSRWNIARLLGMGNERTVHMGGRVTVEHRVAAPEHWVPGFLEAAAEVGLLVPGAPALPAPAAVAPPESKPAA